MSTITEGTAGAPAARRLDQLLAHYGESHRNATNTAIHCVAVPLIMVSLIGLLYALHPWVAYGFLALSMVYYVRLGSVPFLAAMVVSGALTIVIVQALGADVLPVSVAVFVVAWIAQFIGHKIEGRKPSFFEDLQYLLVGPLFVAAKLFNKLGLRY
ncbi:Mpo1 family 2-hydroxy fatty acid dioxygenase [Ramlibacter sp. PS4R-6]|uniref:Mpo1 family 2-hydroxy fatty acid dioxygenase n=1 Tax=Ramlibacter sp. PS4R-6 TaxID=3133438 RepID=UPI0030A05C96